MAQPFLGEVRPFAFNFAPRNYMFASGQILPIQQYAALFSLLGTYYGGNGTTNFALPNLNGRMPLGVGDGNGLTPVVLGESFGTENVSLLVSELPMHTHGVVTKNDPNGVPNMTDAPQPGYFVTRFIYQGTTTASAWYKPASGGPPTPTTLAPTSVSTAGQSQPHNNLQPLLAVNWCIAVQGAFPPRP